MKKLSEVTLQELVSALGEQQEDRVMLSKALQDLNKAIDLMEIAISSTTEESQLAPTQKNLRETFNRISPKWFHK